MLHLKPSPYSPLPPSPAHAANMVCEFVRSAISGRCTWLDMSGSRRPVLNVPPASVCASMRNWPKHLKPWCPCLSIHERMGPASERQAASGWLPAIGEASTSVRTRLSRNIRATNHHWVLPLSISTHDASFGFFAKGGLLWRMTCMQGVMLRPRGFLPHAPHRFRPLDSCSCTSYNTKWPSRFGRDSSVFEIR